jgi:hypothetical protein
LDFSVATFSSLDEFKMYQSITVITVIFLSIFVIIFLSSIFLHKNFNCKEKNFKSQQKPLQSEAGTATSGKLFTGSKVVNFDKPFLFRNFKYEDEKKNKKNIFIDSFVCEKWSVVTTIFEPSAAVEKQALVKDWCLVVVGDKKGPLSYQIYNPFKNFVFLSAAKQIELEKLFPIANVLPWNHFGRKNIGFLYVYIVIVTSIVIIIYSGLLLLLLLYILL